MDDYGHVGDLRKVLGDQGHRVRQGAVARGVVLGRPGQLPVQDERAVGGEDGLTMHPRHLCVGADHLLQYVQQRPVRALTGQTLAQPPPAQRDRPLGMLDVSGGVQVHGGERARLRVEGFKERQPHRHSSSTVSPPLMMRAPGAMELDERKAVRNAGRSGAGRQQSAHREHGGGDQAVQHRQAAGRTAGR